MNAISLQTFGTNFNSLNGTDKEQEKVTGLNSAISESQSLCNVYGIVCVVVNYHRTYYYYLFRRNAQLWFSIRCIHTRHNDTPAFQSKTFHFAIASSGRAKGRRRKTSADTNELKMVQFNKHFHPTTAVENLIYRSCAFVLCACPSKKMRELHVVEAHSNQPPPRFNARTEQKKNMTKNA